MNAKLIADLARAYKRGVPLAGVSSSNQQALAADIVEAAIAPSVVGWDAARGLYPFTEAGAAALASCEHKGPAARVPGVALMSLLGLGSGTIVVAQNLGRHLSEAVAAQAVANLRDPFKSTGRMLVILDPDVVMPPQLRHDVITFDDPMPDDEGYQRIVSEVYYGGDVARPVDISAHAAALRGLSGFEAEQVAAMALTPDGIKARELWEHTAREVSKVKGLSMTLGGPPLTDIKGMDHLIETYTALFNGPFRPRVGVLLDEVEKSMAGVGQRGGPADNTGVAQDALMVLLDALEGRGWGRGSSILLGVPGSGKTCFAQSLFAAFDAPLIRMDIGGMTGSLKGQSEAAIREAIKTIASVGGDRVAFIATCNRNQALPAEFKRRFRLQTWYSDVAGRPEKDQLWKVYLPKFGFSMKDQPKDDEGFTGANIRDACELAFSLETTPTLAAMKIQPVMKSDPDVVKELRDLAAGRYLDVSKTGVYQKPQEGLTVVPQTRKVNL